MIVAPIWHAINAKFFLTCYRLDRTIANASIAIRHPCATGLKMSLSYRQETKTLYVGEEPFRRTYHFFTINGPSMIVDAIRLGIDDDGEMSLSALGSALDPCARLDVGDGVDVLLRMLAIACGHSVERPLKHPNADSSAADALESGREFLFSNSDGGVTLHGASAQYIEESRYADEAASVSIGGPAGMVNQSFERDSLIEYHLRCLQMLLQQCNCGADRTGPSAEAHDASCPAK
jgi:hypothetical protein